MWGVWESPPRTSHLLLPEPSAQVKRLPIIVLLAAVGVYGCESGIATETEPLREDDCHASYPDFCIPPPPPDLNCADISGPKPFRVVGSDPHRFDTDNDGIGCEG